MRGTRGFYLRALHWKRIHFNSISTKKGDGGAHQQVVLHRASAERERYAWRKNYHILSNVNQTWKKNKTSPCAQKSEGHANNGHLKSHCVNYLQVSHWLLIRGHHPPWSPTAAYPSRNNIVPRREDPRINISPALAKWHSVANVMDVQKWQLQLV